MRTTAAIGGALLTLRQGSLIAAATMLVAASPGVSSNSDIGHAVQLAHWQAYYEAALPPPAPPGPLDGVDTGGTGLPTLRDKYDRTSAATGMQAMVTSEFTRLRGKLTSVQAQALGGWSAVISRCSTEGAALLTAVNTQRKQLCVAPVLIASLYFESAGNKMIIFTTFLRSNGVNPLSFDGTYDPRLNQRGITAADWNSVLSGYAEPTWSAMRQSVDFVVARAMTCGVLKTAKCQEDAVALVRTLDANASPASLVAALTSATTKYDASSWGYEVGGDGETMLGALQTPST